jgi:hypothetical protein
MRGESEADAQPQAASSSHHSRIIHASSSHHRRINLKDRPEDRSLPWVPLSPSLYRSGAKGGTIPLQDILSRKKSQKIAKKDSDLRSEFLRILPFAPSAPFCGHPSLRKI